MTIAAQPMTVEYLGVENGLTFKITVFQEPGGGFYAQIDVLQGAADFNALYFGDTVLDGSSFSFGKSLGMNGAGQTDQFGNVVDWDSGIKLSDPGLGKLGLNKDTYLTTGETMIVSLPGVDSWDGVAEIGVRATSTSTPSGSIKTVLEPVEVEEPEEPEGPSVVDTLPEPVAVIEAPSVVVEPVTQTPTPDPVSPVIDTPAVIHEPPVDTPATETPAPEVVATQPAETAPADETMSDVPVQEPVSDVPAQEPVTDVPVEEPVSDLPAEETASNTPAIDTPEAPSSTPDADAAYYEDFAVTVGIVEDYPAYEDEPEVELVPDMIF